LDEELWSRLVDEASRCGVSVEALVREAVVRRLAAARDHRRTALQAVVNAEPMEVPELAVLRDELGRLRGGKRC
jgi:hypothetical protein